MIGQDGRMAGLALGKMMTDKEFEAEAQTLRLRIEQAKKRGDVQHPMHLGMIRTANAVVEELTDVAEGRKPATERRLSDPKNHIHRSTLFQEASSDAERRISGGKLDLEFSRSPSAHFPLSSQVGVIPEIKPVTKLKPR